MNKIFLFSILIITACSENVEEPEIKVQQSHQLEESSSPDENTNGQNSKQSDVNANAAEQWLRNALTYYFAQELSDRSTITTSDFDEYKGDMMNAYYTHGIPMDSLKKKWGHKYEVSKEKALDGFLINAHDYINIVINKCELISSNEGKYIFNVILYDTGFETYSESDLTVIHHKGSFAIDDSKEFF